MTWNCWSLRGLGRNHSFEKCKKGRRLEGEMTSARHLGLLFEKSTREKSFADRSTATVVCVVSVCCVRTSGERTDCYFVIHGFGRLHSAIIRLRKFSPFSPRQLWFSFQDCRAPAVTTKAINISSESQIEPHR